MGTSVSVEMVWEGGKLSDPVTESANPDYWPHFWPIKISEPREPNLRQCIYQLNI